MYTTLGAGAAGLAVRSDRRARAVRGEPETGRAV